MHRGDKAEEKITGQEYGLEKLIQNLAQRFKNKKMDSEECNKHLG